MSHATLPRPPILRRPEIAGAVVVGTLALLLSLARTLHEPAWSTDLDQWYYAARALLEGRNPYDVVGPSSEFRWDWRLNYPLPTVLLVLPLTLFPVAAARVCFSALGGAVLGYALGRDNFRRIGLVLSAAFLVAVSRNQWSPFITAAYFVPLAAVFLAAKPNMAVPFVAGMTSWRHLRWIVGVGLAVAAVSLIARPAWPLDWMESLRRMEYIVSPVMRPGGLLYALAILRWRRPDARIFLALVCVPQTPSLYDLLPLYVLTRTVREVSVLSLLTHALLLTIVVLGPFPSFDRYAYTLGYLSTFMIYLPVMIMLLRRPNKRHDEPDPPSAPFTLAVLRARLEALSRTDAVLLLANAAAAALLIWLTMTTRRV